MSVYRRSPELEVRMFFWPSTKPGLRVIKTISLLPKLLAYLL